MKILVISDTHLSGRFDKRKFTFLRSIISKADKVIINGDFWEGHLVSFSEFINSSWKKLFPLLKEKDAVYIYGNHDNKYLCDERVSLFSNLATEKYILRVGNKRLVFQHGHQFFPSRNSSSPPPRFISKIMLSMLALSVRLSRAKIAYLFKIANLYLKRKTEKLRQKKDTLYIFGHTHAATLDIKGNFINSGFINQGFATYLLIKNPSLKISLIKTTY